MGNVTNKMKMMFSWSLDFWLNVPTFSVIQYSKLSDTKLSEKFPLFSAEVGEDLQK